MLFKFSGKNPEKYENVLKCYLYNLNNILTIIRVKHSAYGLNETRFIKIP